jgi:hypothetical protein
MEAKMKARVLSAILVIFIVIPVSAFSDPLKVPDLEGSHMSIPWKDFKELLEKLQPPKEPEEEPPPPAPYTINSAHYSGGIVEGAAEFRVRIEFSVLDEKNWQMVPVVPASLAVKSLKLDGEPALVETRSGFHCVVLKSPGPHTLTGRFFAPTENRLGPRSVSLPLRRTPVTTLSFTIEEPDQEITAEPANVNVMSYEEGVSRLEAVLPPTERVTISWGRKVEAEEAALRVNAEVESLVSLGERLCQVESVVRYEILHRGVTGFKLSLPKEATVVDVSGNGIADWKAKKGPKNQTIRVSLNYEARESYTLTVLYELSLPDATAEVEAPALEVQEVNREVGHVGVAARTNIEVEVEKVENLGSIDVAELPGGLDARSPSPLLFGFKYIGHPWGLKLKATKHKDVELLTCTADSAVLHSFLTKDGEFVTRAVYNIRNNVQQFMRLELPKGSRIFSTFRGGIPVKPAEDMKGNLLIPLEKSAGSSGQAQSFTLEVTYMVELDKMAKRSGKIQLIAPKSDIMTNSIIWIIYAPKDYKYKVKDSSLDEIEKRKGESVFNEILSGANNLLDKSNIFARQQRVFSQSSNIALDRDSYIQAALPVRFTVPQSGTSLSFQKPIIQKHEENFITLKYKKICIVPPYLKRLVKWAVFGTVLFIVVLLLLRRRRLKKQAAEAVSQGVSS